MSKYVFKQFSTFHNENEARIIDSNKLVEQRIRELAQRREAQKAETGGFVSGISADTVELSQEDGDDTVIKAEKPEEVTPVVDVEALLQDARRQADEILSQARMEAVNMRKACEEECEREKLVAIAEGKKQGYEEGAQQLCQERESLREQYEQQRSQLESEYDALTDELEPVLVETITDIYRHIFHVELSNYRDILTYLISSTLRKAEGGHRFVIHVSKDDYPYVSMQKKQLQSGMSASDEMDVIEDITLGRNDCLIETENGIFDCGLGTQLDELAQKLRLLSWSKEE